MQGTTAVFCTTSASQRDSRRSQHKGPAWNAATYKWLGSRGLCDHRDPARPDVGRCHRDRAPAATGRRLSARRCSSRTQQQQRGAAVSGSPEFPRCITGHLFAAYVHQSGNRTAGAVRMARKAADFLSTFASRAEPPATPFALRTSGTVGLYHAAGDKNLNLAIGLWHGTRLSVEPTTIRTACLSGDRPRR